MIATKYLMLAGAAGGLIAGSTLGGLGTKLVYDRIVIPQLERAATEDREEAVRAATVRCQEQITAASVVAAERAKNAERIRLETIHDAALGTYLSDLQESENRLARTLQNQQERDRRYEAQLAERNRSCPIDRVDLDYLNGVRDEP